MLDYLPTEILLEVLEHLNDIKLLSFKRINRQFNRSIQLILDRQCIISPSTLIKDKLHLIESAYLANQTTPYGSIKLPRLKTLKIVLDDRIEQSHFVANQFLRSNPQLRSIHIHHTVSTGLSKVYEEVQHMENLWELELSDLRSEQVVEIVKILKAKQLKRLRLLLINNGYDTVSTIALYLPQLEELSITCEEFVFPADELIFPYFPKLISLSITIMDSDFSLSSLKLLPENFPNLQQFKLLCPQKNTNVISYLHTDSEPFVNWQKITCLAPIYLNENEIHLLSYFTNLTLVDLDMGPLDSSLLEPQLSQLISLNSLTLKNITKDIAFDQPPSFQLKKLALSSISPFCSLPNLVTFALTSNPKVRHLNLTSVPSILDSNYFFPELILSDIQLNNLLKLKVANIDQFTEKLLKKYRSELKNLAVIFVLPKSLEIRLRVALPNAYFWDSLDEPFE